MYQTQAKYLKMWAEPTRKLKHYEMKKYTAHGFHKCNPKGLKNTLITRFIISGEGVWGLWRNSSNSSLCLCLRCWVLSVECWGGTESHNWVTGSATAQYERGGQHVWTFSTPHPPPLRQPQHQLQPCSWLWPGTRSSGWRRSEGMELLTFIL